jgi:hypothetical protein
MSLFDQTLTKINYFDFCSWFRCPIAMLAIDDPTHWTFTIFPEMRKYIDEHDKSFHDYFP